MSAKPDITPKMARVPESVMTAVAEQMERDEQAIATLKRQLAGLLTRNAILQAETNEAQLQAAHQIALSKFSESQMFQRVLALEAKVDLTADARITALEKESDRLNNWILGNVVQRDQEYENMRAHVSYLMGSHNP